MKKLLLVLALALAFSLQPSALAQISSQNILVFTNLPATVAGGNTITALSATTNYITLWQNSGLALQARWNVGGTDTTAGGGVWVYFSVDGTNYGAPIIVASANTSKTVTQAQTNWSSAQLAGFTSMTVQLTNSSGSYYMTNSGVLVSKWYPNRPF